MSHPSNPENLPMRPPTPLESAYDVLAVRWWWWTDPCPRGPHNARGVRVPGSSAEAPYREALRRLCVGLDPTTDIPPSIPACLELAMALACGDER